MIIKKFKLFENLTESDLEDVKDIFSDIIDLKYDHYKIKDGDGSQYQKVFDVNFTLTKYGNISVNIICDYLYVCAIEKDIKSLIFPILRNNLDLSVVLSVRQTKDYVTKKNTNFEWWVRICI